MSKVVIIGKGKVGEATAQTLTCQVDFHDPFKNVTVSNLKDYDIAIICVDTLRESVTDHDSLQTVLNELQSSNFTGVAAIRSTVSPDFSQSLNNYNFDVVMFPEFMRQTDALKMDTPWIVILGGNSVACIIFKYFLINNNYCTDKTKYHLVSIEEAVIIKLCQNAGLATKVIFYNMVNEICEKYNANYENVRIGVGADERVGIQYSLVPSPDDGLKGFKGHCLPKDVTCLASVETEHGFFKKLLEINLMLGR